MVVRVDSLDVIGMSRWLEENVGELVSYHKIRSSGVGWEILGWFTVDDDSLLETRVRIDDERLATLFLLRWA